MKTQVSDEAVREATGRGWDAWFAILDSAQGTTLTHKEIVAFLSQNYDLSGWWEQMITVTYEKSRGLRDQHESPDGFAVSVSKTVNVNVDELYRAWHDEEVRSRWLDEVFEVRKATPSKSLRITWSDETHVDVYFYEKGSEKSQVSIQHKKLADRAEAESRKAYWKEAFNRLKPLIEGAG